MESKLLFLWGPWPGNNPLVENTSPHSSPFSTSSELLAQIIDLAEDAIISIDQDQRIVLFNQGAERIFGYRAQEALGQPLDLLLPERFAKLHHVEVAGFAQSGQRARRKSERALIQGRRKDGTEFPAEASISRVDAGEGMLLTVILRDVTQRVAASEKLRESVREKEALLREIHHRVKNNLQVMSSLLGLQARSTNRADARQAFEDSQGRIHSMALIHEVLCGSPNFSRIDIADYTRQLADYRLRTHAAGPRIRLATNLEPAFVDLERAVPYGIIANELLTNALRHGFPVQREGEVRVTLQVQANENLRLRIEDNGVGFPRDFAWASASSLGFRLVKMLAEQVKASVEIHPQNPTAIDLTFSRR